MLRSPGFDVVVGENLDRDRMVGMLSELSAKVNPGDVVLFYFAGHGIALDGSNYILPSDVPDLQTGDELRIRSRTIAGIEIVPALRERGARIAILILDACRDNPYRAGVGRTAGQSRGLVRLLQPTTGVFSLYSAGFGQTALDRLSDTDSDPNSVFTRALLPLLGKPGLELNRLALDVRKQTFALAATVKGGHVQFPAFYNELLDEYYLAGRDTAISPDRPPVPLCG